MKKIVIYLTLLLLVFSIGAQEQKPTIVVMDFFYKDISAKDMSTSAASVTTALENTEMFEVISVEDRNTILKIKKYDVESCLDPVCQAKAAKALGVDLYLSGNIGRLANKYIFHMAITNAYSEAVVYEGDKIFEDFSEMVDSLKIMTYEICGVDPETMPQDDVVIVEKLVERKMSTKDIIGWSVIVGGAATVAVGGLFLLDANNFYYQEYQPALNAYDQLVLADEVEYYQAFNNAESIRQEFTEKIWPGVIIGGAGVVTLVTGLVVLLWPQEVETSEIGVAVEPVPSGLSFRIKY